jgi:hypothetical protein
MSRFTRIGRRGRAPMAIVLCLLSAAVLAGCRDPRPPRGSTTTTSTISTTSTTAPTGGRPTAVVEGRSTTLRLSAFGCWTDRLCVDPPPPGGLDNSPDIGETDEVTITIAVEGLTFSARFMPLGAGLGSSGAPGTMTRVGPTSWRLRPPPSPGSYLVTISGGGAQGDLTYVFRWTVD